jgi:uncharacterized membrane protein YuzA (DUF378 family)
MFKGPGAIIVLLLGVVALGLLATVRGSDGLSAIQAVVVMIALSGLGGVAFLMGRAHARRVRERRKPPPP